MGKLKAQTSGDAPSPFPFKKLPQNVQMMLFDLSFEPLSADAGRPAVFEAIAKDGYFSGDYATIIKLYRRTTFRVTAEKTEQFRR